MKIRANLISSTISSNTHEAFNLLSTQHFGERKGDKVIYSLSEAFFLLNAGKMEIFDSKKKNLSNEEIERKFVSIDKRFKVKFLAFSDLRKKGFIIKSALKFGTDFRVYEKGKSIGLDHARWLLSVFSDKDKVSWRDFAAKNRIAHSTKKALLLGIIDDEENVTYFETSWLKP